MSFNNVTDDYAGYTLSNNFQITYALITLGKKKKFKQGLQVFLERYKLQNPVAGIYYFFTPCQN